MICVRVGCSHQAVPDSPICAVHIAEDAKRIAVSNILKPEERRRADREASGSMADRYPRYYKRIPEGVTCLDIYAICQMFPVEDPSGAINHARKKLLIPGTRTGGKSIYNDVKEARDTLTRWLELNAGHTGRAEQAQMVKQRVGAEFAGHIQVDNGGLVSLAKAFAKSP